MECKLLKISSTRRISVIPRGDVEECQACSSPLKGAVGVLRVSPAGSASQYSLLVCEPCYLGYKWRATIKTSAGRFTIISRRIAELDDPERFAAIKVVRDADEFALPDVYPVKHHVHSGGEEIGIPQ